MFFKFNMLNKYFLTGLKQVFLAHKLIVICATAAVVGGGSTLAWVGLDNGPKPNQQQVSQSHKPNFSSDSTSTDSTNTESQNAAPPAAGSGKTQSSNSDSAAGSANSDNQVPTKVGSTGSNSGGAADNGGNTSSGSGSGGSSSGGSSGSGTGGGVSPAPNSPPTAPQNPVASTVSSDKVTIQAAPASDSDGSIARYELLRDGAIVATTTSAGNPVVLSDTSVTAGATYTYNIRAVDNDGAAGPNSKDVVVTIPYPDTTPPSAPTNFHLVSNDTGSITLAWNASTDNVSPQSDLWYIITSPLDESDFYIWTQDNPFTTTWFDTPGVSHDIYIQAVDDAGNKSAKAGPVTFTAK